MTIPLTLAQEQRLTNLSAQTNRTPDDLAHEGMDRFLESEEDILAVIKRGRADIAAGRLVEHDEVLARLERALSR